MAVDLARKLVISVIEGDIDLFDAANAEEMFLTSTSLCIAGVRTFNGAKIGARGTIQPYRSASGEARHYTISPDQIRAGDWNLLTIRVWDGGGANNLWSNPANWSYSSGGVGGAGVPLSTHTVVFDGGSASTATVDMAVSVASMSMSGFTAQLNTSSRPALPRLYAAA